MCLASHTAGPILNSVTFFYIFNNSLVTLLVYTIGSKMFFLGVCS